MIVVCEKCETKFRLDPSRIGREGAKVRCSRCKHRFHVDFELPDVDPHPIVQDVMQDVAQDTSPTPGGNEPDLDNPEFLIDKPSPMDQGLADGASDGVLGLDAESQTESELELDFGSVPDFSRPDPEPKDEPEEQDPCEEERGGVDIGADLEAFRLGGAVEETGPGFRVSEASGRVGSSGGASFGARLPDATLDEPTARVAPTPIVGSGGKARLFQSVAIAAALFLVSGFARAVWLQATFGTPAAFRVEANGWSTSGVESFHVQDLAGTRVLVVRGDLVLEVGSSAARPLVVGTLVGGDGRPLGKELLARPLRIDDAALSPERLPSTVGRSTQGQSSKGVGFTLLFNVPDPNARTVRLELRERS